MRIDHEKILAPQRHRFVLLSIHGEIYHVSLCHPRVISPKMARWETGARTSKVFAGTRVVRVGCWPPEISFNSFQLTGCGYGFFCHNHVCPLRGLDS